MFEIMPNACWLISPSLKSHFSLWQLNWLLGKHFCNGLIKLFIPQPSLEGPLRQGTILTWPDPWPLIEVTIYWVPVQQVPSCTGLIPVSSITLYQPTSQIFVNRILKAYGEKSHVTNVSYPSDLQTLTSWSCTAAASTRRSSSWTPSPSPSSSSSRPGRTRIGETFAFEIL